MTLYLVKWDDGSSALVHAEDEASLVDTLDQLGDPGSASWVVYDGPLWLEFPAPTEQPEGDVAPTAMPWLRPTIPATDTGQAFEDALFELLHPGLYVARERALDEERAIDAGEYAQAVDRDRVWALPGSLDEPPEGPEH